MYLSNVVSFMWENIMVDTFSLVAILKFQDG